MNQDKHILEHAKILWDYHKCNDVSGHADFILAMGSHDLRPAVKAAELFNEGKSDLIVCSGGYGKVTKGIWKQTEAEKYAEVISANGVPVSKILIEPKASNTGENISMSRSLLAELDVHPKKGLIVTKPYMCRRARATARKQWPEVTWMTAAPEVEFSDYPNEEVTLERTINLMVGDLQRILIYPEMGFQAEEVVPDEVKNSYDILIRNGYDNFLIR